MILLLGAGQDETLVGTKVNITNAAARTATLNLTVQSTLALNSAATEN